MMQVEPLAPVHLVQEPCTPDQDALAQARALLAQASKPMLYVGA